MAEIGDRRHGKHQPGEHLPRRCIKRRNCRRIERVSLTLLGLRTRHRNTAYDANLPLAQSPNATAARETAMTNIG